MYASESQLGYDTTIRYPADVSLYGKQWDIDVRVWVPQAASDESKRKGKGRAGKGKGKFKGKSKDKGDGSGSSEGQSKGSWVTRTYQTSRMLSNIGAEAIRGRGTRVWEASKLIGVKSPGGKVLRLVKEKKTVVLKDSWIDDDRDREAVIIQQIIDSAPDDLKPLLIRHLLTVVCYGDVPSGTVGTVTKDTTAQMRRSQKVPEHYFKLEIRKAATSNDSKLPTGSGVPRSREADTEFRIVEFDDKCHHRTVFEEVGTSIDTLNSVFEVFTMLAQVAKGWYPCRRIIYFNSFVFP